MPPQDHIRIILGKNKEFIDALVDGTENATTANNLTENWTSSNPHYAALMAKQDEIVDFINDAISDYQGKIADLVAIANS